MPWNVAESPPQSAAPESRYPASAWQHGIVRQAEYLRGIVVQSLNAHRLAEFRGPHIGTSISSDSICGSSVPMRNVSRSASNSSTGISADDE